MLDEIVNGVQTNCVFLGKMVDFEEIVSFGSKLEFSGRMCSCGSPYGGFGLLEGGERERVLMTELGRGLGWKGAG